MSKEKKKIKPYGAPRLWESMAGPIFVIPAIIGGSLLLWALIKEVLIWAGVIG